MILFKKIISISTLHWLKFSVKDDNNQQLEKHSNTLLSRWRIHNSPYGAALYCTYVECRTLHSRLVRCGCMYLLVYAVLPHSNNSMPNQ